MNDNEVVERKKRHWCLLVYLLLMLIGNALNLFVYLNPPTLPPEMAETAKTISWLFPAMAIFALINLISAVAILKWKKWGVFLFTMSAGVTLKLNLDAGVSMGSSLFGIIGVVILYGVLCIGGDKKGWTQLE